jgi:3'-phosphoadenosine 5'-phosphosulfate (PAPS) 3'-phosphatase
VGDGAWEIRPDGSRSALAVKPVHAIRDASFVFSRSHKSARLDALFHETPPRAALALGSAGLKCLAVARGDADAYVHPGTVGARWDVCGPGAIIEAAGGKISTERGAAFRFDQAEIRNLEGLVVTAGGALHDEIVAKLRA